MIVCLALIFKLYGYRLNFIILEHCSDVDLCQKGLTCQHPDNDLGDKHDINSDTNDSCHGNDSPSYEVDEQCTKEIELMKAMGLPISFYPEENQQKVCTFVSTAIFCNTN